MPAYHLSGEELPQPVLKPGRSLSRRASNVAKSMMVKGPAKTANVGMRGFSKLFTRSSKRLAAKNLNLPSSRPTSPSFEPTSPATECATGSADSVADGSPPSMLENLTQSVENLTENLTQWVSDLVAPSPDNALPTPPPLVEVPIVKRGVPWRGNYERTLVIDVNEGKVTTLEPETRRETNCWQCQRDVKRAVAFPDGYSIDLWVTPWPEAPEWAHLPVRFTSDESKAALRALADAGVTVETSAW